MKKLSILKLSRTEKSRLFGGYSCNPDGEYACRVSSCTCREQLFYNNSHFTDKNASSETTSAHNHGISSNQKNPDYYTL